MPASTDQGTSDPSAASTVALPLEIPFYRYLGSHWRRRTRWLALMLLGQVILFSILILLGESLLFYVTFLPLFWMQGHGYKDFMRLSGTWHVFRRDDNGELMLERQYRFRGRVWRRRKIDLAPYTWLRVCEPGDADVCLELGNWQYQTYSLGSIADAGIPTMSPEEREQARAELVALGAQVAQLTGVEDRGWRSIC